MHFVGHGHFDPATQDGVLVLEDANRAGSSDKWQRPRHLVRYHRSLAPGSAQCLRGGHYFGRQPLQRHCAEPAAAAHPRRRGHAFEISDKAAITFTQGFYGALADGYPVDAALTEARKSVFFAVNKVEWATPVLYTALPRWAHFQCNAGRYPSARAHSRNPESAPAAGAQAVAAPPTPAPPKPDAAAAGACDSGTPGASAHVVTGCRGCQVQRTAARSYWLAAGGLVGIVLAATMLSVLGVWRPFRSTPASMPPGEHPTVMARDVVSTGSAGAVIAATTPLASHVVVATAILPHRSLHPRHTLSAEPSLDAATTLSLSPTSSGKSMIAYVSTQSGSPQICACSSRQLREGRSTHECWRKRLARMVARQPFDLLPFDPQWQTTDLQAGPGGGQGAGTLAVGQLSPHYRDAGRWGGRSGREWHLVSAVGRRARNVQIRPRV